MKESTILNIPGKICKYKCGLKKQQPDFNSWKQEASCFAENCVNMYL